jgi:hypothetical protein
LEFLLVLPSTDIFARNVQGESVYDIAAEKGDLQTCELIERYERMQWPEARPNGWDLPHIDADVVERYDRANLHIVIPCIVVENARVNVRTRQPDPRLLTRNVDPSQYSPVRKEDISLPPSADASSAWVWMSKWNVFHNDGTTDPDGWRFAQRWDTPDLEWVSDPTITPVSRSGLVARRTWLRIMKKCPAGQEYVGNTELSDNEYMDRETSQRLVATTLQADARRQPARINSMSARLVGLVAGSSKGK